MALSLLTTTVNNASGNQTPNCFVSGAFVYNMAQDIHVESPTNVGDSQIFTVRCKVTAGVPREVTWDSSYKGQLAMVGTYDPGDDYLHLFYQIGDNSYLIGACQINV